MPNMSLTKVPMPEQDPNVRNKNFLEVAMGYTEEMAMEEASRCLNCKNKPCVSGCPVNVRIPEFVAKVAEGKFEEAYEIITSTNSLPAISGRVCPQENQCEGKCVRGIKGESVSIGRLERFCADYHNIFDSNELTFYATLSESRADDDTIHILNLLFYISICQFLAVYEVDIRFAVIVSGGL